MSALLSSRPDLAQIKRQAKELLKAQKAGDQSVCDKLRKVQRFAAMRNDEILSADIKLADAQHALAKDYGFNTWADLRQQVLKIGEENLLHIHCGDIKGSSVAKLVQFLIGEAVRTEADSFLFGNLPEGQSLAEYKGECKVLPPEEWNKELGRMQQEYGDFEVIVRGAQTQAGIADLPFKSEYPNGMLPVRYHVPKHGGWFEAEGFPCHLLPHVILELEIRCRTKGDVSVTILKNGSYLVEIRDGVQAADPPCEISIVKKDSASAGQGVQDSTSRERVTALASGVIIRPMTRDDFGALRRFDDEVTQTLNDVNAQYPPGGHSTMAGGPWSNDKELAEHFDKYQRHGGTTLLALDVSGRVVGFADLWPAGELGAEQIQLPCPSDLQPDASRLKIGERGFAYTWLRKALP